MIEIFRYLKIHLNDKFFKIDKTNRHLEKLLRIFEYRDTRRYKNKLIIIFFF